MFHFFFHFQKPKAPQELQREQFAKDAKELKDYLSRMTPEARAKFWAVIEGKGDDREKQTPSGN